MLESEGLRRELGVTVRISDSSSRSSFPSASCRHVMVASLLLVRRNSTTRNDLPLAEKGTELGKPESGRHAVGNSR